MNKNSTHDVFGNKFYTSVGFQCLQSYVVYVLIGASEGLRERTEHLDIFLFFLPVTQWCSVSDVLFTGGRGVSDFSVLRYY